MLRGIGGGGGDGVLGRLAVEEARDGDLHIPLAAVQQRDGFFQVLRGDGGELLQRELLVCAERGEVGYFVRNGGGAERAGRVGGVSL